MMRLIIFLILNFGALALGALFMGGSPADNEWYISLNKAPWTPPGWVFGAAWTTIMITYSVYMSRIVYRADPSSLTRIYILYTLQWVLNVIWNPVFFYFHLTTLGVFVIIMLIIVLLVVEIFYSTKNTVNLLLLIPYVLWLFVALSLNLYAAMMN